LWPPGQGHFWPSGHNLNNIGRGPLDDAIRYTKYESSGPCSYSQEDSPTLIGDHPGIIPVKFGQIPISGSREDVVWSFPYIIQC